MKENNHSVPEKLTNFRNILNSYECFIFDVVGIIHNGIDSYPLAIECVNNFIILGKKVLFLTNSSQSSEITKQKLVDLGLTSPFQLLTAGDIAKKILENKYQNKKIFLFGKTTKITFLQSLNLHVVLSLEDADIVLLSTYPRDKEFLRNLDTWIANVAKLKISVICVNPDLISPHGTKTILCAGHIAKKMVLTPKIGPGY